MDREELLRRYAAGERDFSKTSLRGIFLDKTDLRNINLSGADLSGADFSGVNLSGADLSGANLRGARLCEVIFAEVNLSGANLKGADFNSGIIQSNLTEAILDGTEIGEEWIVIRKYCFDRASLRGATLRMALITRITMRKAILDGVLFCGVSIGHSDFTGASLEGCNLKGVILS